MPELEQLACVARMHTARGPDAATTSEHARLLPTRCSSAVDHPLIYKTRFSRNSPWTSGAGDTPVLSTPA